MRRLQTLVQIPLCDARHAVYCTGKRYVPRCICHVHACTAHIPAKHMSICTCHKNVSTSMFVLHLTPQVRDGWAGTLCIGEQQTIFMVKGSATLKGRVAFNSPLCLGSHHSFWIWPPRALCGFLSGLSVAFCAFLAWILSQ